MKISAAVFDFCICRDDAWGDANGWKVLLLDGDGGKLLCSRISVTPAARGEAEVKCCASSGGEGKSRSRKERDAVGGGREFGGRGGGVRGDGGIARV